MFKREHNNIQLIWYWKGKQCSPGVVVKMIYDRTDEGCDMDQELNETMGNILSLDAFKLVIPGVVKLQLTFELYSKYI